MQVSGLRPCLRRFSFAFLSSLQAGCSKDSERIRGKPVFQFILWFLCQHGSQEDDRELPDPPDHKLHPDFNIDFEQFNLGLDAVADR